MMNNNTYKPSKQDKILAHFYKNVATLIKKSPNGRVALTTLEERMTRHKYAVFSWLQWRDAKEWFTTSYGETPGLWYALKPEYAICTLSEIYQSINKAYNLYQNEEA